MRILAAVLGGLVGLLSVLGVSQWIASESGEVVVLTTLDAEGERHDTRLWVVDHDGHAWLRAGSDVQQWYRRLVDQPEVVVERGTEKTTYAAVPVPDESRVINRLMLEKYGWADQYIGLLFGRDDAVPVRLDPK
jgi:hypothetical protein